MAESYLNYPLEQLRFMSPLSRSLITWIDTSGIRCFADLCYRRIFHKNEELDSTLVVVSERFDNPGDDISQSSDRVVNAISARLPPGKVVIFERYDRRSCKLWPEAELPRYRRFWFQSISGLHPAAVLRIKPVSRDDASFLDAYMDDYEAVSRPLPFGATSLSRGEPGAKFGKRRI